MAKKILVISLVFLLFAGLVSAAAPNVSLGACYSFSTGSLSDDNVTDLVISEVCGGYGSIDWTGHNLNLSALGAIAGGVVISDGKVSVDVGVRPDLDFPAVITAKRLRYVYQPEVLKDGVSCGSGCDIIDWSHSILVFNVSGFSVYNFTGRQDMVVQSDVRADLQNKVYQVVDLGATNETAKCFVMVFDRNGSLIQTNPPRERQGSSVRVLSSSSDSSAQNMPENLGYFPTENGIANVYYRKDLLVGYNEFIYVVKCNTVVDEYVYEERMIPQYKQAFKSLPARLAWYNNPDNASTIVLVALFVVCGGLIVYWLIRKAMGR
jgi:hypothetical protein